MLFTDKRRLSDGAGLGIDKYPSPKEKKLCFHSRRKLLILPLRNLVEQVRLGLSQKAFSSFVSGFFNVNLALPVRQKSL